MEGWGWMAWVFGLSAMGIAGAAMSQIASLNQEVASLKKEVKVLTDELCRRGLLEQPVGERKIIVRDSLHSK